jgi:hypothetical protein
MKIHFHFINDIIGKQSTIVLRCNNVIMLNWIALRTCFIWYDFECHKKFRFSSLNNNYFLDEIIKGPIQLAVMDKKERRGEGQVQKQMGLLSWLSLRLI